MGVQGLWQVLEPVGHPVSLESLENKVLAVDASLWLHQAVHGFRDGAGNPLPNAHLLGLFHRVCKLLFYRIKPVFVFDGTVPLLKKRTMAARRERRRNAEEKVEKTRQQILNNYLQSQAIREAGASTANGSASTTPPKSSTAPNLSSQSDLFELPTVPPALMSESEDSEVDVLVEASRTAFYQDLDGIDVESEDFQALPPDIQHEFLVEMKERNKRRSWIREDAMPEDPEEIGRFQLKQLLIRRKLQRRIDTVRKQLNASLAQDWDENFTDLSYRTAEARRILSEDAAHYFLFRTGKTDKLQTKNSSGKAKLKPEFDGSPNVENARKLDSTSASDVSAMLCIDDEPRLLMRESEESSEEEALTILPADDCNLTVKANASPRVASPAAQEMDERRSVISDEPELVGPAKESPALDDEKPRVSQSLTGTSVSSSGEGASIKHDIRAATASKQETSSLVHLMPEECKKDENESDDDDFIEVVIRPSEIKEDELFPLEMFLSAQPTISADVKSMASEDEKKEEEEEEEKNEDNKEEDEKPSPSDGPPASLSVHLPPEFAELSPPRLAEELRKMEMRLEEETRELLKDAGRKERAAATITDQMCLESQELLRLFGVPFVVSPGEAEAQCAALDQLDLTEGTITDDSDVWLFGARRVYRHFFEREYRQVVVFSLEDLRARLRLDRSKLVAFALLTGSDYTDGVRGVGPVRAMEILAEFPDADGFESLRRFRAWWDETKAARRRKATETPVKQALRRLVLMDEFPSSVVHKAYMEPAVDSSDERFTWASPDFCALKQFAASKLRLSKAKVEDLLLPVVKKLEAGKGQRQTSIDSYFPKFVQQPEGLQSLSPSRRLQRALRKICVAVNRGEGEGSSIDDSRAVAGTSSRRARGRRKRGAPSTRGRGPRGKLPVKRRLVARVSTSDLDLSESSESETT